MRCKTVMKHMSGYVDGMLRSARTRRVRDHLGGCDCCRAEEDLHRLVLTALEMVPEADPPEDGLHRLETRLAFLPPRPEVRPAGRLRSLALPYAAGLATAAAFLLLALPLLTGGEEPSTGRPPVSGPVADGGGLGETPLLEGEKALTPVAPIRHLVDERGTLYELPPRILELLRRMRTPVLRNDDGTPRMVDFDWRDF